MKKEYKQNSGVTLVALIITVIVILIIASIAVFEGNKLIKTSKIQTLETNMLTIQMKSKAYAEEIQSKIWTYDDVTKDVKRNQEFKDKGFIETNTTEDVLEQIDYEIEESYVAYSISAKALEEMGLSEIMDEKYIIIFNKNDYKLMDVIFVEGIVYKNNTIYTLSRLQESLDT